MLWCMRGGNTRSRHAASSSRMHTISLKGTYEIMTALCEEHVLDKRSVADEEDVKHQRV